MFKRFPLLFCLFLICANSCTKIEPFEQKTLTVSHQKTQGTKVRINFSNPPHQSLRNYSITSSESWCRAEYLYDPIRGGEHYILIHTEANPSCRIRTARITLTHERLTQRFDVRQDGIPRIINVISAPDCNWDSLLPPSAQDLTIEIETELDYSIQFAPGMYSYDELSESLTWISVKTIKKGTSTKRDVITLHCNKNDEGGKRFAWVLFQHKEDDYTYASASVNIYQGPEVLLNASVSEYSINQTGGNIKIQFNTSSRTSTYVCSQPEWVSFGEIASDNSAGNPYASYISATVSENKTGSERTGILALRLTNPYNLNTPLQLEFIIRQNGIASDAVDLGLSVFWRDKNLGATTVYEKGVKSMWGDNTGNITQQYDAQGRPYGHPYISTDGYSICGNPSYDIVTNLLGDGWRLPTSAECKELLNNCVWTTVTENGVTGRRAAKNGKSIFFPYSGTSSTRGRYWTGTAKGKDKSGDDEYGLVYWECYSYYLDLGFREIDIISQEQFLMIRPVKNK